MLFDGSNYWLMQGIVHADRAEAANEAFQRMAASFRRKWDTLTSADGRVSLDVPASWNMRSGLKDDADLQAGFPVGEVFAIVISDRKEDLEGEHATLRGFAELTREGIVSLATGDVEEVETSLDGLPTLTTSVTFQDGEDLFRYHHHAIEGREHFYQLLIWSYEGDREPSRPDYERIRDSFTEHAPAEPSPTDD